jgi:hypothetical protein
MKKQKPSIVRIRCLKKTKKFYRNLGMKNIEAREPPSMAEAETCGKSLWGEEAQHNERAEWIRREQKRKISLTEWRPIQISEIASYLLKAHNSKSPGNDQIQNYCNFNISGFHAPYLDKITGLRLLQLLTGILQKPPMQ